MKPPSSARTLMRFSLFVQKSPSNCFQVSHFNTFPSSGGGGNTTSFATRKYEDESRNVRVSVWWDFENCAVPASANVYKVAQFVTAAVRANGIKGPVQITAFGDVYQLSRPNQEALSSIGINLSHVPNGGKNSADRSLLIDLMYWVSQNPPPAHLFLISGDRDFSGILHRLRMNNYNILLASPESVPSVLCSAASIMWNWNCLINGENLYGKHYNQPPDGPYGSWYGHYKAPLDNPFAVAEQPVCPRSEDSSDNGSDSKIRPIPKSVIKHIRQILSSFPDGISITELRSELSTNNVYIEKDFYGYKKFSRFLLAMPTILKLQSVSEGHFLVRGVKQKVSEQVQSSPSNIDVPVVSGKPGTVPLGQLSGDKTTFTQNEEKKSTSPLSSEKPTVVAAKQRQRAQEQPQGPILPGQEITSRVQRQPAAVQQECKEGKGEVIKGKVHMVEEPAACTPPSFFQKLLRIWFGHDDSEKEVCTTNGMVAHEKMKSEDKDTKLAAQEIESLAPASLSLSCSDATTNREAPPPSEANIDKNMESSGFFSHIFRRLRFWTGSVDSNGSSEEVQEHLIGTEGQSDKNEIFGKASFWDELRAFFGTTEAAAVVMQSTTRKGLAQNLQEKGPSVLRSLSETDLNHLLKLLISDKKWIEESSSAASPFKLILGDAKNSLDNFNGDQMHPSGLTSIFSNSQESSLPQKLQQLDGQTKCSNPFLAGASQPVAESKPLGKSRVLSDCQKLIEELLKDSPKGFHMAAFRRLFLEKYGYALDIQSLGHHKLTVFLQTFSGVRIESNLVVPAPKSSCEQNFQECKTDGTESNSESETSDAPGKEDDNESVWEELGPVATSGRQGGEKQPGQCWKTEGGRQEKIYHDYESLSDDILSDSDEEIPSSVKSENKKKSSVEKEDSSLLQILDSWYSSKDNSKEDSSDKDALDNLDDMADSSGSNSGESSSGGVNLKTEAPLANKGRKQKSSKSYSFVAADQPSDSRDKLVDGILNRIKKAGEKSSESRM